MAIIVDPERDQVVRDILTRRFLDFSRDPSVMPAQGEVEVTSSWGVQSTVSRTPLLAKVEELFRRFLGTCMGVTLDGTGAHNIEFVMDEAIEGGESSLITVEKDGITVRAGHERGLLHGAMRILRAFANQKAPFLPLGRISNQPRFSPRISTTVFYRSNYKLSDIDEAYPHDYLALMALYGINGVFWELDFYDFCSSAILPELSSPAYETNLQQLKDLTERLALYGVDLYLLPALPILPEHHPVFIAHPDVRGATTAPGNGERGYCLCSSSERVARFYEDSFSNLYRDVPLLQGPILLIGGERFMHCYTRPEPPLQNKTNCPSCQSVHAPQAVANLVNRVTAAVRRVRSDAVVFCWPYSAFTWSGPEDNYQLDLIDCLSADVCFLSMFSSNDLHARSGATLYDYNIMLPGASRRFQAQATALREQNRGIWAKAECSTTPLMFQVPYLPVMYRWAERVAALKAQQVNGVFGHWRYYGFSGNPADEFFFTSAWEGTEIDDFLKVYCLRQYGEFSPAMLDGWKRMSEAWEEIPYSAALVGERQWYVKGPLYLGPAHPFIFDVQNDYGLRRGFTRIRSADLFPDVNDDERERLSVKAYASDLMWTWPVGSAECEAALIDTSNNWSKGVQRFCDSFLNVNRNASFDIAIGRIIGLHFQTAVNLVRFYRKRDAFLSGGGSHEQVELQLTELAEILREEIRSSEEAIALVREYPEIGYGYAYGIAYDARMIEEKIKQCRYVINTEIPDLAAGMNFHLYGIYP